MPIIDIIAEFGAAPGTRLENVDAVEVTTDLGETVLAINLDQAMELSTLWASQPRFDRGWTIPDNTGTYDGIVYAFADDSDDGVGMEVWEAYDLATGVEQPVYRLDTFPFAIRTEIPIAEPDAPLTAAE